MIAFDLDGCLIDSEELVRQSYRDAGAEPPAGFFSFGHHNWIDPPAAGVYRRKNAAYLRRLAAGPPFLPAWDAAVILAARGEQVVLLTGSPAGTVAAVRRAAPTWPFAAAADALTPEAKTAWLAQGTGVYVDDQRYVTVPPGWRFVRYARQSAGELLALIGFG